MDAKMIARAVKEARLKMGVTQYDLSIKSGVKPSTISLIENGERVPRADTLAKLCKALDISYNDTTGNFVNHTPSLEDVDIEALIRKRPEALDDFLDYVRKRLGRKDRRVGAREGIKRAKK